MDVFGTQNLWYLKELVRATRNSYRALSYQQLVVAGTAVALTVPAEAVYALISLESDATGVAIRFLELGAKTLPTTTTGIGRSNLDAWDVIDTSNLINFRVVQTQAGTHTLNIQYYGNF
jgi:hypothetical protein